MKSFNSFFVFLVGFSTALVLPIHRLDDDPMTTPDPAIGYVDRECGSNLTNLWLDVVVVVDNSHGMTKSGLTQVASNIVTVFGESRIGVQDDEPRTTRVGIVTYSDKAAIVANLDTYQSSDDFFDGVFSSLNSISTTDESYLAKGLSAAEQVLQDGAATAKRAQYKQVVLVYASSYKGAGDLDPLPVADRLKTSGVSIVTLAFSQHNEGPLLKGLRSIGSPNYNYANTDSHPVQELQGALVQINCFCPDGWTQYRSSYSYVDSYRFGVCMAATVIDASWRAAQFSCRSQYTNAYLINEYDLNKHNYILDFLQNITEFKKPYTYHLGLSYSKGTWNWEQPAGKPQKQLQQWSYWNPGYPKSDSTLTAVTNFENQGEESSGWQNVNVNKESQFYLCEVAACDTENFCEPLDN
ncbi:unnamed protein product [Caenorhabditis nigoni]